MIWENEYRVRENETPEGKEGEDLRKLVFVYLQKKEPRSSCRHREQRRERGNTAVT